MIAAISTAIIILAPSSAFLKYFFHFFAIFNPQKMLFFFNIIALFALLF